MINTITQEKNKEVIMNIDPKEKFEHSKLMERFKELHRLYGETFNDEYLMEDDSLQHYFECGGLERYEQIALFCDEHNIKRVVDIGAAYGHQSEVFLQSDIDYIGVNSSKLDFWNQSQFKYISGMYPCSIPVEKGDLGISVLCLTWNCYLYEKEKTLREQCEALQKDFEHVLLYMMPEKVSFVSKYFNNVEEIGDRLFYFNNN